jgi:hypothetical protein
VVASSWAPGFRRRRSSTTSWRLSPAFQPGSTSIFNCRLVLQSFQR